MNLGFDTDGGEYIELEVRSLKEDWLHDNYLRNVSRRFRPDDV